MCAGLLRQVRLQVDELICQQRGPDDVDGIDIRTIGAAREKFAPQTQLIQSSLRCGQKLYLDAGFTSELCHLVVAPVSEFLVEPARIKQGYGNGFGRRVIATLKTYGEERYR